MLFRPGYVYKHLLPMQHLLIVKLNSVYAAVQSVSLVVVIHESIKGNNACHLVVVVRLVCYLISAITGLFQQGKFSGYWYYSF